ncbi:MAG: hypothetical protein D6732_00005, partial [Methanobacteriota archaeon]
MKEATELKPEVLEALKLTDFVAVDIETTGLDYQKDSIIEVAAVRFHDGMIVDTFNSMVNPHRPIPEHITRITGITSEDVYDAPSFEEIADDILSFVDNYPIIAHNV